MARKEPADRPYLSNYPLLEGWLQKHNAHCAWQYYDERHEQRSVEGWFVGQALVVIVVHADGHGWDIFTPSRDPAVVATFADAEARLGVKA